MAFFSEQELQALAIDRMVFHLVGPKPEDFVRLEEINPGRFASFFLDRIRSVNAGVPYKFSDASATRERLRRISLDGTKFQEESERLADDFQRAHIGSAVAGAVLLFTLSVGQERMFALLKYDDEEVLTYDVVDAGQGRKRVNLDALERTFVQNKEALQKSALIKLNDEGGELAVLDRRNQQKVARYFENFLDVIRIHENADLTAKLVDVTRQVIKGNKDLVPPEIYREVTKRTYDAAAAGGNINADAQRSFLEAVIGRNLPDGHALLRKFDQALRSARIDGTPVALDVGKVSRPGSVRYVTTNGIQIRVPQNATNRVIVQQDQIIIRDRVEDEYDDTNGVR